MLPVSHCQDTNAVFKRKVLNHAVLAFMRSTLMSGVLMHALCGQTRNTAQTVPSCRLLVSMRIRPSFERRR